MSKILSFDKLSESDQQIKHRFLKELLKIASESPENLYNHLNKISELLDSDNKIMKLTGIELIGYLSSVDTENKIYIFIKRLIKYLHSRDLIISSHAISALIIIAQNKPRSRKKIINEFLLIENGNFKTEDCKNILIGKVLEAFKRLLPLIGFDERVVEFAVKAKFNKRSLTRNKAEELILKLLLI